MASYSVKRGLSKGPAERVLYFATENCHLVLRQRQRQDLYHKIEFKGHFASADIAEFLMLVGRVMSFLVKSMPHWRKKRDEV